MDPANILNVPDELKCALKNELTTCVCAECCLQKAESVPVVACGMWLIFAQPEAFIRSLTTNITCDKKAVPAEKKLQASLVTRSRRSQLQTGIIITICTCLLLSH